MSTEDTLDTVADAFGGTVPNLYRMLARNPAALKSFVQLEHILEHDGLLARGDRAIVALEVAIETGCAYCRAALCREAEASSVERATIVSILGRTRPRDLRASTLIDATRRIMAAHGRLGRTEIAAFERRGLGFSELLEVISVISAFTLATYANNLARTRIDPEYR